MLVEADGDRENQANHFRCEGHITDLYRSAVCIGMWIRGDFSNLRLGATEINLISLVESNYYCPITF